MSTLGLFMLLAVLAGACLATQVGVNATLSRGVSSPLLASWISFVIGTVALGAYALAVRVKLPGAAALASQPWWAWSGGVLGAFYVTTLITVAPRLGGAAAIGLVIAGQMSASIALDHFGVLGFAVQPVSLARIAGAVLIVGGVVLIRAT